MDAMRYDNFFSQLMVVVPEFRPVYDEDIRFFGEEIPHGVMGVFTRFFIDAYVRSSAGSGAALGNDSVPLRALRFLEEAVQSTDVRVRELVAASFLENLWQARDSYDSIRDHLGPNLRRALAVVEGSGVPDEMGNLTW